MVRLTESRQPLRDEEVRSVAHREECGQSEAIGASPQGSVGILILTRVGAQEVTQDGLYVTKTATSTKNDSVACVGIFILLILSGNKIHAVLYMQELINSRGKISGRYEVRLDYYKMIRILIIYITTKIRLVTQMYQPSILFH